MNRVTACATADKSADTRIAPRKRHASAPNIIAGSDLCLLDSVARDERAIRAPQVFDEDALALPRQARMPPGYSGIGEDHVAVP